MSSPSVKTAALLNDAEFVELCCMPPEANALLSSARRLRQNLEMEHGISVPDTVARDLYGEAGYIVDSVVSRFEPKKSIKGKDRCDTYFPEFRDCWYLYLPCSLLSFLSFG